MDFVRDHVLVERAHADVRAGRSLAEVMDAALRSLEEHHPLPLWRELRSIDFGEDARQSTSFIAPLVARQPPPARLAAVWFGLAELSNPARSPDAEEYAPERTESVVSLAGGTGYPDPEWAYAQEWYPDGYLPTEGLAGLASRAARSDRVSAVDGTDGRAYRIATYDLALAHSIALASDVMRGEAGRILLGDRDRLAVVAGFHDGDVAFIGELTAAGLDVPELRYAWV